MNNSIDPNKEKQQEDVRDQIARFLMAGGQVQEIPAGVSGEVHKAGQVQLKLTTERAKHDKIKRQLGESL